MSVVPRECGARLRWVAWSLFWAGFASLGLMQAWGVFGDNTGRPALADLVDPVHFWFPTVLLLAPSYVVSQPLTGLLRPAPPWIGAIVYVVGAVWVLALSRMIVWAQDRLHPAFSVSITAWTIGGIVAAVVAMRLLAQLPPVESNGAVVSHGSFVLLTGLVGGAWLYIVAGIVAAAARRLGRRRRVNHVTTSPTSFPPA
jgi:hypothetical protein